MLFSPQFLYSVDSALWVKHGETTFQYMFTNMPYAPIANYIHSLLFLSILNLISSNNF